VADRWATFDCYGTMVDWNSGVRSELARLLGDQDAERWLHRYHEVEPRIQSERPDASYRDVMASTLAELAAEAGVELPDEERDALGRSLPRWPVFGDVAPALTEAREHGWSLVILSNTDRDFIDASMAAIGVPFEGAIVASEIGSYKPAHGHWQAFREQFSPAEGRWVHVAQSHFHDIVAANQLGLPSVWINRQGETGDPPPTRELPSLTGLADTLDELVPA